MCFKWKQKLEMDLTYQCRIIELNHHTLIEGNFYRKIYITIGRYYDSKIDRPISKPVISMHE